MLLPLLQALAEEMDAQNESLAWLNKQGPPILANPSMGPQERDMHVAKLRAINLSWSKVGSRRACAVHKPLVDSGPTVCGFVCGVGLFYFVLSNVSSQVTRDLMDKAGEVETNMQGHAVFQDRMNRLTDWVQVTHQTISARGVSPVQAQVPPPPLSSLSVDCSYTYQ